MILSKTLSFFFFFFFWELRTAGPDPFSFYSFGLKVDQGSALFLTFSLICIFFSSFSRERREGVFCERLSLFSPWGYWSGRWRIHGDELFFGFRWVEEGGGLDFRRDGWRRSSVLPLAGFFFGSGGFLAWWSSAVLRWLARLTRTDPGGFVTGLRIGLVLAYPGRLRRIRGLW